MADKKKWVKNVTEHMKKGAFKAKAEKAGESTEAYAHEEDDASGKTGKQARLAESLMSMHKASKKHHVTPKKMMTSMYGKEKE